MRTTRWCIINVRHNGEAPPVRRHQRDQRQPGSHGLDDELFWVCQSSLYFSRRRHTSVMATKSFQSVNKDIVRWAHTWAAAASQTYETIESISIPESPATEIGRRDAMTMVLVDAVRNVVKGAELSLGKGSEVVRRFSEEHPDLKNLRDRFEHYEDYVRGAGIAQRECRKWGGKPLELDTAGIEISASSGGGREGHLVSIVVIERDSNGRQSEVTYEAPSKTITVAVRRLARDLVDAAGMLDERHLDRCEICADPFNI